MRQNIISCSEFYASNMANHEKQFVLVMIRAERPCDRDSKDELLWKMVLLFMYIEDLSAFWLNFLPEAILNNFRFYA